jgi:hypothetical protein
MTTAAVPSAVQHVRTMDGRQRSGGRGSGSSSSSSNNNHSIRTHRNFIQQDGRK